jgi:uncharacterized protein YfiM (DUF2279 family)
MKKALFFISVITFLSTTGQSITSKEFWKPKGQVGHCVGVFTISTATYAYLSIHKKHRNLSEFQKRLISFSAGMLVGILKEIGDSMEPNNFYCWKDMQANAVGAIAFQVAVTIPLSFKKKKRKTWDIADNTQ